MMHQLVFAHALSYSARDGSVNLPVVLRSGTTFVDLFASLDTGASHCLFEAAYSANLELTLNSGVLTKFQTANSNFEAYGHEIEIDVLGIVTRSLVYFFAEPSIRKNVLGRSGWLDRVRVGLVDHDRQIYLAPYDEFQ